MKELSLNILDIAQNSVKAMADEIDISLVETNETLLIEIKDNGCGMTEDFLKNVEDPFTTTRTTRKVGLGIPLLKLSAEQTGGNVHIVSRHKDEFPNNHGTVISALFYKNHLDFTPLGNITDTITTLIQCNPNIRWCFRHEKPEGTVKLDTNELKAVLGDVPLSNIEVVNWIDGYIREQYDEIG